MRIKFSTLLLMVVLTTLFSCKKYNQIDNSSTVKTPYILYIGGIQGNLYKTNDGLYYNNDFPFDHSAVRQILAADTMLLYVKQNMYFSRDEGKSFYPSNLNGGFPIRYINFFYKYFLPNTALYAKGTKLVYLCADTKANGQDSLTLSGLNNLVLKVSSDNGITFQDETNWNTNDGPIGATSITQLNNGDLFIIKDSANIYRKIGTGTWDKVAQDTTHLPTDTTIWYLSHTHDTLIAVDFNGRAGVRYSIDNGKNWNKTTGLPKTRRMLFGKEALGSNFYIGLDSAGLYKLNGSSFSSTSAGIPWYAKVGFAEGKKLTYRTDVERYYWYCATDVGLFVSESNGQDWRLIKTGAYSTLY